ncbi:hypothetical protein EDC96DRAFT_549720 [Choanephora cucurbitarum]|nr:hypothetical protein EDC96DRAFT_549720 [Choanephora cucurbitarum]
MSTEETIPNLQHQSYPFESAQHFFCHAFFNASDSMYSEHDVKKIMSFVRQIVNLTNDNDFTLPSDNKIIDFANSVRSNIPTFNTTEHEAAIANTDQKAKFYMNKPSEYIGHLVANSSKINQLSRLPDYTPNEGMLLNQAGKWRDHPLFQAPYVQYTSEDGSRKQDLITPKTIDGVSYARLVRRPDGEQHYMKVQIIPYILYTDETSGNTSKQYNKFDSVQMVFVALPISERNKRENVHFILTSNKKLSVVDMLPSLVENLVYMERGFVAYSSFYGEDVLVVSPLCFIAADDPRHAELCDLMGHSANYFCRKCLQKKRPNPNILKRYPTYTPTIEDTCVQRKSDFIAFADGYPHFCNLEDTTFKKLGSKNVSGSKTLLALKSFDPALDAPIELLHTLPLSLVSYLGAAGLQEEWNFFPKKFHSSDEALWLLCGGDFKMLAQIISFDMRKTFNTPDGANLIPIMNCFTQVGRLCSLLHHEKHNHRFSDYISLSKKTIVETLESIYRFGLSNFINIPSFDKSPYPHTLKVHLLNHIIDDVKRFGSLLNCHTERSEQFNKFIRKRITYTNRQHPSRDVAVKFGKHFMLQHLVGGGLWIPRNQDYRTLAGPAVSTYFVDHPRERHLFFGAVREFDTHNTLLSPKPSQVGLYTISYTLHGHLHRRNCLGIVDIYGNDITWLVPLRISEDVIQYTFKSHLYPNLLLDCDSNTLLQPCPGQAVECNLGHTIHVFDTNPFIGNTIVVNSSKFSSLWLIIKYYLLNFFNAL